MKSRDSFRDFVLDQLTEIRDRRARAMFGGIGLYAGDTFFGLIAADTLYLKVDDTNRAMYERAGSAAFKPYADKPMTMPYYNVPAAVVEDASELAKWARMSMAVASSAPERGRRRAKARS